MKIFTMWSFGFEVGSPFPYTSSFSGAQQQLLDDLIDRVDPKAIGHGNGKWNRLLNQIHRSAA